MVNHVGVHLRALPPAYKAAVKAHGGDPWGFPEIIWFSGGSHHLDGRTILSVSSPGVPITGAGEEGRKLARELNIYLGGLATSTEARFSGKLGFFSVLPDGQDLEGTCAEIDFLFAEQKLCNGVGMYTTYGDKLPGHESFKHICSFGDFLSQPIVDYPLATTRAAVDLVVTDTVRSCPDVGIILSHAGGTLHFIERRAIGALTFSPIVAKAGVTPGEAVADFARLYVDTALSASAAQLNGLTEFIASLDGDVSHILFGSDFPYAPPRNIQATLRELQ
ncbi:hypothetical protein diail_626 [Diaporthe ilicicola]|nr:hypothetical protein diail_626 [Diaporthe ilicicola]